MQGKRTLWMAMAIILVFGLSATIAWTIGIPTGHAQTTQQTQGPRVIITWRTLNSYAPPSYAGKVLPNAESKIAASVEVISNGHLVDLSRQTIYWYLDENLLGGSIGTQSLTFQPYSDTPNTAVLKVELPDYSTGLLIHEIDIPVVTPSAVIEAAYPGGVFSSNQPTVQALPYFFATTSTSPLSFAWSVNGQTISSAENPQTLQISVPQSTPAGFTVSVALTIQNPNDFTSANATANLTYQKTL